jgi:biotin operon repressor
MAKQLIRPTERLEGKSALTLFSNYLRFRYNFSRVVSESLYNDALYFQLLFNTNERQDGQIFYYGVSINEPAGKALKDCSYVRLTLTLYHTSDLDVRTKRGLDVLRRHKIKRLCDEAATQGGTLSQEDLAYLLNVSRSTIVLDLKKMRRQGIEVVTRAHYTDQGRGISHKDRIIRLFLQGFTISDTALRSNHDIKNVENYINDFFRIVILYQDSKSPLMICKVTRKSMALVNEYIELYDKLCSEPHYRDALERQLSFYTAQLDLNPLKKTEAVI